MQAFRALLFPALAALAPFAAAAGENAAAAGSAAFRGRFRLLDAVSLHVPNPAGEGFELRVSVLDPRSHQRPTEVMLRVFEPGGRLAYRHSLRAGRAAPGEPAPEPAHRADLPGGPRGIYEIVLHGFPDTEVTVSISPAPAVGVAGHVGSLLELDGRLSDTRFLVPPGLDTLPVSVLGRVDRLRVEDETGRVLLDREGENPSGRIPVARRPEGAWRLRIEPPGPHRISFGPLAPILCPDGETARAIGAGMRVLDDGTIAFHPFQERAWALLERYRALPPETFDVPLPDLREFREHWTREPARNLLLFGGYGAFGNLPPILHGQNLDPRSPWFGAIHFWKDPEGRPYPGNPHARLDRMNAVYRAEEAEAASRSLRRDRSGGGRHMARETDALAGIYTLDEPFNPLFGHPALLQRIIIGLLQDLMMIRPHEMVVESSGDASLYYGGMRCFSLVRHLKAFSLIAPHLPEEVREVATEGMRRLMDRNLIGQVHSTVNQWSHYPTAILAFYQATGEEEYREWALRHVDWILNQDFGASGGRAPAGYMAESEGPDATYNGMTATDFAILYNALGEPRIKEAIRRVYELFNHTLAPDPLDPASRGVGASDFCHRTPGDWWSPQGWGGGLAMMADHLPEAGLRNGTAWLFHPVPRTAEEREESVARLLGALRYNPKDFYDLERHPNGGASRIASSGSLLASQYRYYARRPLEGRLPATDPEPFARNFGGEFFAVRRAPYYALSYAGAPMGGWQRHRRPEAADRQHVFNAGGFSLFWSPSLGASLLGKNWGAVTAHTLIARRGGQSRWVDYWSVTNAFSAEAPAPVLTAGGRLAGLPLSFRRSHRYGEAGVEVLLEITAAETGGALRLDEFYENFPLLWRGEDHPKNLRVTFFAPGGRVLPGGGLARAAAFDHPDTEETHLVVFDPPRRCRLETVTAFDYLGTARPWRRIRAELPAEWNPGQRRVFGCRLLVLPRDRVAAALAAMR